MSTLSTIPLIPPSFTNKLLPFPIIVSGIWFSSEYSSTFLTSSSFFTFTKISAIPPILKEVCFDINSFSKILVSSDTHFFNSSI